MKKSELIDMFGLSGDSSSNDQLDDLLFFLESDIPNVLETNSKVTCLPSYTPLVTLAGLRSGGVPAASKKQSMIVSDLIPTEKAGGLLYRSPSISMRRFVVQ